MLTTRHYAFRGWYEVYSFFDSETITYPWFAETYDANILATGLMEGGENGFYKKTWPV